MVENIVRYLARKHFERVEELTLEQFEDALLGAIRSDDFIRCVQSVEPYLHRQGMVYVPYAEKMGLEEQLAEKDKTIAELKEQLVTQAQWEKQEAALHEILIKTKAENQKLRECVEFYSRVDITNGERARQCLKEIEGE